jgi:hypothetical protein
MQVADLTSLATGRNPRPLVNLRLHWQSWFANKEVGVQNVLEEIEKGYVTVHKWLPFMPYHTCPFSIDQTKPSRLRVCSDDSFGEGASSNNKRTATWLMAKLRFAALDRIVALLVGLLKKCWEMRRSCAPTAVLWIGIVDLTEAYRQLAMDTTEVWASGFVFPDMRDTLRFGVDRRYGFGGSLFPLNFCRVTNFNVHVISQKLHHEYVCALPLQTVWRTHLTTSSFTLCDGILPKQMHGRKLAYSERLARGDEQLQEPEPSQGTAGESLSRRQARRDGLIHPRPVIATREPLTPYCVTDTAAVVAHIDDHLLALIAPEEDQQAAEQVRVKVVKGTFAAEHLPVDQTERSRLKDAEGAMARTLKFLGILWDLTDINEPTLGIPPGRATKLLALTGAIVQNTPVSLPRTEVLSLAGKLVNVACVVNRGRIHVCGVFGAISTSRGAPMVKVTKWMLANVAWWHEYLTGGATPCSMLVLPPTMRYVPTTDASGKGYQCVTLYCSKVTATVNAYRDRQ